jgi:hypothetical protein
VRLRFLGVPDFTEKGVIKNIREHLKNKNYSNIFIYTNNFKLFDEINIQLNDFNIISYDKLEFTENDRLYKINDIIENINLNSNDLNKLLFFENELKQETKINNILLENSIINYLIILNCVNILTL